MWDSWFFLLFGAFPPLWVDLCLMSNSCWFPCAPSSMQKRIQHGRFRDGKPLTSHDNLYSNRSFYIGSTDLWLWILGFCRSKTRGPRHLRLPCMIQLLVSRGACAWNMLKISRTSVLAIHRYRREIPDLLYHPVWWHCLLWSSSLGIQHVKVLVHHTHRRKHTQKMCPRSLSCVQAFHTYL